MTPRFRPDLALSLVGLLLVAALALPVPAMAAIVVGDGTAASCTELALRNALLVAGNEGGATIRFQCGKAPVTIALIATGDLRTGAGYLLEPAVLTPPNKTTIDGGGLIALEGGFLTTVVSTRARSGA